MKNAIRQAAMFCCLALLTAPVGPAWAEGVVDDLGESPQRPTVQDRSAIDIERSARSVPKRLLEKRRNSLFQGLPLIPEAFAQTERVDRSDVPPSHDVSPSHVFQATLDLISEIHLLRDAMGVADFPGEAEAQEDRAPVHAYAKSLEVMKKVSRFQRKLGIRPGRVGQIPVKNIVPKDVLSSVQATIGQLRRVKKQLVIGDKIQPAPFEGAKTPSMVYKNLGDASLMLDGLVGRPITPNDVFGNVLEVLGEMELIATKLKVALGLDPPRVEGRKRPKDVAQQVLRATYKVINLQTRLGMDASGVPTITLVRITPAEVYEVTNILLAEMVRIKTHLNVRLPRSPRADPRNKTPTDVFARVLLVIDNLDLLAKAAAANPG